MGAIRRAGSVSDGHRFNHLASQERQRLERALTKRELGDEVVMKSVPEIESSDTPLTSRQ